MDDTEFDKETEAVILQDIEKLFKPPNCANCNLFGCRGEYCICASCNKRGASKCHCTIEEKVRARWRKEIALQKEAKQKEQRTKEKEKERTKEKEKKSDHTSLLVKRVSTLEDELITVKSEMATLKEEIENLKEIVVENNTKRKRMSDEGGDDDNDEPVVVPESRECIVCVTTKPVKAFTIKGNRKNKDGTTTPFVKVRRTCNACYTRKYRENKKARTETTT